MIRSARHQQRGAASSRPLIFIQGGSEWDILENGRGLAKEARNSCRQKWEMGMEPALSVMSFESAGQGSWCSNRGGRVPRYALSPAQKKVGVAGWGGTACSTVQQCLGMRPPGQGWVGGSRTGDLVTGLSCPPVGGSVSRPWARGTPACSRCGAAAARRAPRPRRWCGCRWRRARCARGS